MSKQLKNGTIKCIDRESLEITILGPPGEKGYFKEKNVSLHCIDIFTDFKSQVFELLRKLLIGQKIQFQSFALPDKKVAADIFINKKLVSFILVEAGLAKPKDMGKVTSNYIDDLKEIHNEAKNKERGYYGAKEKVQKIKYPALDNYINQKISGIFEHFNFEMDFTFYCNETNEKYAHCKFAGVKICLGKKENICNLKNMLALHSCQRDAFFVLKSISESDVLSLYDFHITDESSILKKLFLNGYAKLENDANTVLDSVQYFSYKSIQDQAMKEKKGVWENYKGPEPSNNQTISEPEFEGIVQEIIPGTFLRIKSKTSKKDYWVSLTNIKIPKFNKTFEPEKSEEYGYEAYAFLRKNYIGKQVKVKIDEMKLIKGKDDTDLQIVNVSLVYDNKPIGVGLLENGLANFKQPKFNDVASPFVQDYATAFEQAQEKKRGIHSNKQSYFPKFLDLTQQKVKKSKGDFLLKGYEGYQTGIVIHCFSGTKYKIQFDKANICFMFQLNSLKTFGKNFENESQEKIYKQSQKYAQRQLLQRDVQFWIENTDKFGNAHGSILINNKNIATGLLQKGLAYVDRRAHASEFLSDYEKLERVAKEGKIGVWQEGVFVQKQRESKQKEAQQEKLVSISEGDSFENLFFQEISLELDEMQKKIKGLIKNMKNLAHPIPVKSLVLGKFENEFYRCWILKKKEGDFYEVQFIDFGNVESIDLSNLKDCPEDLIKIRPFGFQAKLDFVKIPDVENYIGEQGYDFFDQWCGENKIRCILTRKNKKGEQFCELFHEGVRDEKKSINFQLVEKGFALLDEKGEKGQDQMWIDAQDKGLKINPALEDAFEN